MIAQRLPSLFISLLPLSLVHFLRVSLAAGKALVFFRHREAE